MIDIKTLSTTGLAVLTKAVNDFKREGFIDTVTAFDLTLEGIDPDEALDYAEEFCVENM